MGTVCSFHGDVAVQLVPHDITERKELEEAVHESESGIFQEHFGACQRYILYAEHGPEIIYVSPQVEQVLGYTVEEVLNKRQYLPTNSSLISGRGSRDDSTAIKTGEKQGPYLQEYMHKDGTKRLAEINESPLKNDKGEVIGIVGAPGTLPSIIGSKRR